MSNAIELYDIKEEGLQKMLRIEGKTIEEVDERDTSEKKLGQDSSENEMATKNENKELSELKQELRKIKKVIQEMIEDEKD